MDALPAVVFFGAVLLAVVIGLLRLGSKTADAKLVEKIRGELDDSNLPRLELKRIAYLTRLTAPQVHDDVAIHPNAYPELVEWIDAFAELRRSGRATNEAVQDFPEPPVPGKDSR